MGQAVFGGNPRSGSEADYDRVVIYLLTSVTREPEGSPGRVLYDEGVRFACWGMSMYSLSCSCYSFLLDKMVARFRAKPVYIGGQLVYSAGMVCLALTRTKWAVLVFSWTAGVMYSTLFTMPYLLVTVLHCTVLYCTVLYCTVYPAAGGALPRDGHHPLRGHLVPAPDPQAAGLHQVGGRHGRGVSRGQG